MKFGNRIERRRDLRRVRTNSGDTVIGMVLLPIIPPI